MKKGMVFVRYERLKKVNIGHITYKVVFVRYELLKVDGVGYQISNHS